MLGDLLSSSHPRLPAPNVPILNTMNRPLHSIRTVISPSRANFSHYRCIGTGR
jgi:hypothetical protein